MVTFKFVSKREKSNSVVLRVTSNRKSSELSMGFSMDADLLAEILSGAYSKATEEYRSLLIFYKRVVEDVKMQFALDGRSDNVSAVEFRNAVKTEALSRKGLREDHKKDGFIDFYQKKMNAKVNAGYKASIKYTLDKIIEFCNDKEFGCGKNPDYLTFEDISLKWLNAFDEWLMQAGCGSELSQHSFQEYPHGNQPRD